MESATATLLARTEQVIKQAKGLLARHCYPMGLRTLIVIGFIDQMIEHHEAMLLLVRNENVGSAFALARSIVESMYRGLWINFCATDAEIEEFEHKDELPLNMSQMARAIDEKYRAEGFFQDFRKRSWASLCSYTHTGLLQLGRRFTGENLQPAYRDEEISEAITSVTTCILLLVGKFLAVQNHEAECREAEGLVGTYGVGSSGFQGGAEMPASSTKMPLMKRLGVALENHGLSFGDALNIALFLLTVFSLIFAYEGVRIARIALDEANKAAQDQQTQFSEQIEELKKSSQALETARTLLRDQSDTLRSLQGISQLQLRDLNKAESRVARQERARPAPHIEAYCAAEEFIDASGSQLNQPIIDRAVKMYAPTDKPDEIPCQVRLTNDGDAALRNISLELTFSCFDNPHIGISQTSKPTNTPLSPHATFFQGKNVAPSDRILIEEFVLVHAASCANIEVAGLFESDNFHEAHFHSEIQVQNPTTSRRP